MNFYELKSSFKNYSLIIKTITLLIGLFFVKSLVINSQPFRLIGVSDLERVFEDGYNIPARYDTLSLFGIKGEILSGQMVVHATKELENVSVEIGKLTEKSSGLSMPPSVTDWNFVGSVFLPKNASNQPVNAVKRKAPARFPDYLMAEKRINIKAGIFQAIWLTIRIPESAIPGTYLGNVTVKSTRGAQMLPVCVTIYPLSMPSSRHLKVTEWYRTNGFEKFHGIKELYSPEWFDMLSIYAENMAEHRQNVFQVPMSSIGISKSGSGALDFDFSTFDNIAQVFWDTKKMDYLETGELAKFGEGGFASTEIILKDFSVNLSETKEKITMSGHDVIPFLLPAFESHLRQKGWLDKTLFHIKDEPSHHNALNWISTSRYMHYYAPDLKRVDALCTSFLFGNIEVAVPKLDHLDAGYDKYKREQQKGTELWFYTVGIYQASMYPNKTIDMPLIDNRILHWLNYKYDLTGYLHWGWNQWTDDPFTDPDVHVGDGWHVYPAKDGILNSLRWEQMRNGIQDYEYFWMLEDKIRTLRDSLGSRFSWIDPKQRSKEIISQVVKGLKEHSDDPIIFYKARKEVINELMDFETSPKVYIQTSPVEHGNLINRSVVELLGWTEPGNTITVNGANVPVLADGLFMERFLIYVGGKLVIKAKKGLDEKVITRSFNVTY